MRSQRLFRWAALPITAALALVLTGCTQAQLNGFLPGFSEGEPPVTGNTERVSGLWVTSWLVLLVVGVTTWGLIIWAVIMYRRRKGHVSLPPQLRYNMPIEVFYTVVPLILVLGFFAFTARDQMAIEQRYPNPDVRIEVLAKQWAWDFNYVDANVFSPGVQVQPTEAGKTGAAEAEIPTLYLPVNKKIEITLLSRDVIHSFWVIDFLYKKDVIPGRTNYMSITPQRVGTFAGKCAELCGEYHSQMLFTVKVVTQEEFDTYTASLAAAGHTGQLGPQYDRNHNLPGVNSPRVTGER